MIWDLRSTIFGTSLDPCCCFFSEFRDVSGLSLIFSKCVIAPLWLFDETRVRTLLMDISGSLSSFVLSSSAKYLGVFLGPNSASLSWQAPLAKYLGRIRDLRNIGLGLMASARLYNIGTLLCL